MNVSKINIDITNGDIKIPRIVIIIKSLFKKGVEIIPQ